MPQSCTETLPAAPFDGQTVDILCSQTITILTVDANSGQTAAAERDVVSTSCSATQGHSWRYLFAEGIWVQRL